jgi:very-short-patch-repair endonuclease
LVSQGFRLHRFSNREIMTELEAVLDTIHAELHPSVCNPAAASREFTGDPHHGRIL